MVHTRGSVKKHGDYVEVSSTDSQHSTVSRACSVLGWPLDTLQTTPTLVRVSGCKIPDHPLIDADSGNSHPWTIGQYLKQTFSSRSTIKLGLVFEEVMCMQHHVINIRIRFV